MTSPRSGFTLIELLVSLALIVIILGIGVMVDTRSLRRSSLEAEKESLAAVFAKARNEAMSNLNESPRGVAILPDKYIIFAGNSFSDRNQSLDKEYVREADISISGPAEIIFQRLSGAASPSSTLVLSLEEGSVSLSLNQEGMIE